MPNNKELKMLERLSNRLAARSNTDDDIENEEMGVSGWALREVAECSTDLTQEMEELIRQSEEDGLRTVADESAAHYHYIFVPGLMTEHYGEKYMRENFARMDELGLSYQKLGIDTDADVRQNSQEVRDAVMASEKPVVLFCHSKGGIDTSAALALFPEMERRVRAFIAVQVPYGGTYVCDFIKGSKALSAIAKSLIEGVFKGDIGALRDLAYKKRQKFIRKFPLDTKRIPTISYVSKNVTGPMKPLTKYLKRKYNVENDGLVPHFDGMIPGSDFCDGVDIDHAETVMCSRRETYPADLTQALITLALRKAREMEARRPHHRGIRASQENSEDENSERSEEKSQEEKSEEEKSEEEKSKEEKSEEEKSEEGSEDGSEKSRESRDSGSEDSD